MNPCMFLILIPTYTMFFNVESGMERWVDSGIERLSGI